MNDEKMAREKLMSRWAQFERSDKDTCEATIRAAGPSYVALLTCLEIAEEVERPSRKPSRPSVDGQSPMTMEFSAAVTLFVYEIKSDKTDHVALHKGAALRLARR
jgi:hypothetical protein